MSVYNSPTSSAIFAVSLEFGLSREDLIGKDRKWDVSHIRQMAMSISRDLSNLSLSQIGRAFGDRDHTTVLHAINAVNKRKSDSPEYLATYNRVMGNAKIHMRPTFIRHSGISRPVFKSRRSGK